MIDYKETDLLLNAHNICFSYGPKVILADCNLQVKDIVRPGIVTGQVISIVGRSGMGKSTLIGILSGIHKPTSGSVFINLDQHIVRPGDMGIVPQNYYMPEHLRIKEMFYLAAYKNKAYKKDKKTINEYITSYAAAFELTEHIDKFPIQLSGGQRQRASICMQLLNGSNFLLMDEPFSGLDPIMIDKTVDLLKRVACSDELKTIIIVSHDLENCAAISDHIYILSNSGRQPGTGATIVKQINLIERDIAYHEKPKRISVFHDTIEEIKTLL